MPEAVLRYEDKEIALPTEVGSEGEIAIDIGRLRAETGLITVDRGFANTAETRSAVSYIDGEKGILRYRGYPDRKSTRLNSSHSQISYAVFCLKKKTHVAQEGI